MRARRKLGNFLSPKDPTGPTSGSFRVLRGGSWGDSSRVTLVPLAAIGTAVVRGHNLGFRLVRELD
jgi:formylglycine-generating enzyme required for sulfatase activity